MRPYHDPPGPSLWVLGLGVISFVAWMLLFLVVL